MKKLFLSLFICLFCATFLFAQENSENEIQTKNALGFFGKNLNSANGPIIFGINYQRWLNDYIGIQGTIANDYVNNFQKNGEDIFFNADLELQVKILSQLTILRCSFTTLMLKDQIRLFQRKFIYSKLQKKTLYRSICISFNSSQTLKR